MVKRKDFSKGDQRGDGDLTTDVAVIGAGGAGMVAALTAAERGSSVMVFEKRAVAGGTSNFPSGPFAAESKMQLRKYMDVKRDDLFKIMMEYSHWRAQPRVVRAVVDKSGSTIDWLQDQGVEFIDVMAMTPGGLPTWHLLKGHGGAMIKVLLKKARDRGVDIRLSTGLKELVKDGDRIRGLIVEEKSGNRIKIQAKSVVIATGGYTNSKKWIKKYTGFELGKNLFPPADLKLTGDGIQHAWKAGAAEEGMGVLILQYTVPGPGISGTRLTTLARQPYLWVNQTGRRFCDEAITANWPFAGNSIAVQKGGYGYLIFDGDTRKYIETEGFDIGAGPVSPTTKCPDVNALFRNAIDKGNENVFTAGSLKKLGDAICINPEVLRKTVDEYNSFCDKNHDGLFAKDPKYLRHVRKPNFYAMRIYPRFLGTLGGIRINEKTEVLNVEQEVIQGLYAAGNDAGGMYVGSYDLWVPGGALGFALNTGRIAGESAADYSRQ